MNNMDEEIKEKNSLRTTKVYVLKIGSQFHNQMYFSDQSEAIKKLFDILLECEVKQLKEVKDYSDPEGLPRCLYQVPIDLSISVQSLEYHLNEFDAKETHRRNIKLHEMKLLKSKKKKKS